MERTREVLDATNWPLLQAQKKSLLWVLDSQACAELHEEGLADIDGLVNFVDCLQDAVVADGLKPEQEVFPNTEEN